MTTFQRFRQGVAKNVRDTAKWIWNTSKNAASTTVDWIYKQKDKIINKIFPPKLMELVTNTVTENLPPTIEGQYWKINETDNEGLVSRKVEANRLKHGKEYNNKYLKMYYYNDIKSLEDIQASLMDTYKKESKAFKLLLSFGYATENIDDSSIKLFQAAQQYFCDEPQIINNRKNMNRLISEINGGTIIHKIAHRFPNTKTRLLGVYSMAVK